jgi:hypothetical protein
VKNFLQTKERNGKSTLVEKYKKPQINDFLAKKDTQHNEQILFDQPRCERIWGGYTGERKTVIASQAFTKNFYAIGYKNGKKLRNYSKHFESIAPNGVNR